MRFRIAILAALSASHTASVTPTGDTVVVVTERPLTAPQMEMLQSARSLLIMVPGVSSGDPVERRGLLARIRAEGGHDLAVFYDWESANPARRIASPTAVGPAAGRLVDLGEAFQGATDSGKSLDLLAHSAGTVVVNKAAETIVRTGSPVRFRRVLFLGTALSADEPLEGLKKVSRSVLNVHSAHDSVNRNINDREGRLDALGQPGYRNVRIDRTLGGRLVRHYTFLSDDPENWLPYVHYLRTGEWFEGRCVNLSPDGSPEDLHRLCLWVGAHPREPADAIRGTLPTLVGHADPVRVHYGAVLTGLLKAAEMVPALKALLADAKTPVHVRREAYQALGNLEDGRHLDFLRGARDTDPACDEVLRDVLRELKRKRVEPIRGR